MLRITQEKQQPANQEGPQQLNSAVCLLGKLRVMVVTPEEKRRPENVILASRPTTAGTRYSSGEVLSDCDVQDGNSTLKSP